MPKPSPSFAAGSFFLLRTPLLPLCKVVRARARYGERGEGWDCTRALLDSPAIREALYLASPSLIASLDAAGGTRKVQRAIDRYITRMGSRPTPFGLFAAVSTGVVGSQTTNLRFAEDAVLTKVVALDSVVVAKLAARVEQLEGVRREIHFTINPTLYRAAGRMRFFERIAGPGGRWTFKLAAVDDTPALASLCTHPGRGATFEELCRRLSESDPDLSRAEIESFVDQAIDAGILLAAIEPSPVGGAASQQLLDTLASARAARHVAIPLASAQQAIDDIATRGVGVPLDEHRRVVQVLEGLTEEPITTAFKVDLLRQSTGITLSSAVVDEIARGTEVMARIGCVRPDPLADFRARFFERYHRRWVPLLEALDPEVGVGLSVVELPAAFETADPHRAILRKLERHWRDTPPARELVLDAATVKAIERTSPHPFPQSFTAVVSLAAAPGAAIDRGEFIYHHIGIQVPSAAKALGRFCQADGELAASVRRLLDEEQARQAGGIYADVIHVPAPSLGNVVARPHLRQFEIPIGCRSQLPPEQQIPLNDLLLSCDPDRGFVLWSRRLDRRIFPTLSNAHNYEDPEGFPVYRFLAELSLQEARDFAFRLVGADWASFVPRLRIGKLVIALARWNLDLVAEGVTNPSDVDAFRAVKEMRQRHHLPRFLTLDRWDEHLLLDLEDEGSATILREAASAQPTVRLIEKFPSPEELCVAGPDGGFSHEIVIPFLRNDPPAHTERAERPPGIPTEAAALGPVPKFGPGSDWLYAKIYAPWASHDALLKRVIGPFVRSAAETTQLDAWFFVRYGDPEPHLRLRLKGDPAFLWGAAVRALWTACEGPIAQGIVRKLMLDTYEPETERYGGTLGLALGERLFALDSATCLDLLRAQRRPHLEREHLALRSVHRWLEDFGFTIRERMDLCGEWSKQTTNDPTGSWIHVLGERFRGNRGTIEAAVAAIATEGSVDSLLDRRSSDVSSVVRDLRSGFASEKIGGTYENFCGTVIHVHLNRLLSVGHSESETYDFLRRIYRARLARKTEEETSVHS